MIATKKVAAWRAQQQKEGHNREAEKGESVALKSPRARGQRGEGQFEERKEEKGRKPPILIEDGEVSRKGTINKNKGGEDHTKG